MAGRLQAPSGFRNGRPCTASYKVVCLKSPGERCLARNFPVGYSAPHVYGDGETRPRRRNYVQTRARAPPTAIAE